MKPYEAINRIIRYLERILTAGIICLYLAALYISAVKDKSIFTTLFIAISLVQYCMAITKKPGPLLDDSTSRVKGLCTICKKIRGCRTSHCHVCNKCFKKRDHHCILIGRCISENCLRNVYFCTFFTLLFSISWLISKPFKVLLFILSLFLVSVLVWTSLCIACDRTTSELLADFNIKLTRYHFKRYLEFLTGRSFSYVSTVESSEKE